MSKVRVFISSRETELEHEREIAAKTVEGLAMQPVRFEKELVPQGVLPQEAFLSGVDESDIVVLILWRQFSDAVLWEFRQAKRAEKEILCLVKTPEDSETTDSGLQNLMREIKDGAYSIARFRTLSQLEDLVRQGIALALARRMRSPFQAMGKEQLIKRGTGLIERARTRIVLVARTPIPLVGTRPYDESRSPVSFEQDHLRAFENVIEGASSGSSRSFRCVGSIGAIASDAKSGSRQFRARIVKRLEYLYEKADAAGSRCEIRWVPKENLRPMTYLVADDYFLIWLKDATREDISISDKNDRIAGALDCLSRDGELSRTMTFEEVVREIGL